jgi:hypothetical protein
MYSRKTIDYPLKRVSLKQYLTCLTNMMFANIYPAKKDSYQRSNLCARGSIYFNSMMAPWHYSRIVIVLRLQ